MTCGCKLGGTRVYSCHFRREMKEPRIGGLIERFSDLPDPRVEGGTDHDLLDIVVLALCAVMSGQEGWDDMEDWGREPEGAAVSPRAEN